MKKFYDRKQSKVVVEEGAFVGANSTILCGVTIGKCAVIGAGAVVTKNVEAYSVVGGVPAKFIKKLNN
ncbi:acyltransferase [Clostridium hydrogenum]|uniref:acyltransferase n=1 Tax=Clostridium hydrogenum TaxID=2855764 RepID=UPI0038B25B36